MKPYKKHNSGLQCLFLLTLTKEHHIITIDRMELGLPFENKNMLEVTCGGEKLYNRDQ